MSQINDCIQEALTGSTNNHINDLMVAYYQDNGATSDNIKDAEYEFLIEQGATAAPVKDMWLEVLTSLGYSGSLQDMLATFWCTDGGVLALELNLTSSAEIDAWITKYGGSHTRASTMHVKDHLGVYNEIPIDQYALYGARWDGSDFFKADVGGVLLTNKIGMAFWPTTTNVVPSLSYRDFTHANWTPTNGSITAGDVVLIDGTTVADKNTLTASGANCTLIHDAYDSASGVHSAGVFIKRKTGTGAVELTLDGEGWIEVDVTDEWALVQLTATVSYPTFGIRLATSGDAVYLDWAQMDDGMVRVSVHPIEGGATLAGQNLTLADATNVPNLVSDVQGYIIACAQLLPDDVAIQPASYIVSGNASTSRFLYSSINTNHAISYENANVTTLVGSFVGMSKTASYWWGVNKQLTSNGSSSAVDDYAGSWNVNGKIILGSRTGTTSQFNGIVKCISFGLNQLTTQVKMEAETTE